MIVFTQTIIDQQKIVQNFDEIIELKKNQIKELDEKIEHLKNHHAWEELSFKVNLNVKYEDKIKAVDSLTKQVDYLIKKRSGILNAKRGQAHESCPR
jgi:ribosomal protein S13